MAKSTTRPASTSISFLLRGMLAASALCVGLAARPERGAAQVPLVTTSVTISTGQDTQVDRLSPFSVNNKATIMVDAFYKPEISRVAIKFDQNAIMNAIGAKDLVRASLVLTPSRYADSWGDAYIDAFRLTADFQQSTATWNSMFILGEPFDSANPTVRVTVPNQSTAKVTFDVTKDVAKFTNGTPNYGWLLKDDGYLSGVSQPYNSFEATILANRPQLIIETVDASTEASTATVTFPAPGVAVFSAVGGTGIVDVPVHGLSFATQSAALQWAAAHLNTNLEYDASGTPIAGDGQTQQIGDFSYIDPTGNSVQINDVATAMLGGQDGIVTIGSNKTCIRPEGCAQAPFAAGDTALDCNPTAEDGDNFLSAVIGGKTCSASSSYKNSYIVWNAIGTSMTTGANAKSNPTSYSHSCGLCWKHKIIPWKCCKDSGHSHLEITNTYQVSDSTGSFVYAPNGVKADNVFNIRQQEYALFRAGITVKDNGTIKPTGGGAIKINFVGVCGNASATNGSHQLNTFTFTGTHDLACRGAGQ